MVGVKGLRASLDIGGIEKCDTSGLLNVSSSEHINSLSFRYNVNLFIIASPFVLHYILL